MDLISKDKLYNSPSRKDNVSLEQEQTMRKGACLYMQHAGALLKFPQITTVTSIVFFHRFFSRRSLATYDRYVIATTCLYLAAKVAESPRKIRDIINVAFLILNNQTLKISSEYWDLKDVVVKMESVVLRTLAFHLTVEHPHHYLFNYLKAIEGDQLAQPAWSILKDSYCTTICLQYAPNVIATSCIYLAAKFSNYHIIDGEKMPWWMVFEAKMEEIDDICNRIIDLYESDLQEEVYNGTSEWLKG